jgi:aspartyl-tRNA synthetase
MQNERLEDWRRTNYSNQISSSLEGKTVTVMGWVREIRDLGGIRFVILQDVFGKVQITVSQNKAKLEVFKKSHSLQRQDCIAIKGLVKKMIKAPRGAEIIPIEIKILGKARQPLPLDITGRVPADIDVRLDSRVLDLRSDRNQAIFKIRNKVLNTIRNFFLSYNFFEVQTPKIIVSATEGGAALFPILYFDREAFLAQSPQLYKEELIIDFEKVFEIGSFYRAEKSHTRRHVAEFTSIDIEEAFVNSQDVMNIAELLMVNVCKAVRNDCQNELGILKHKVSIPKTPFETLSYDRIIDELQNHDFSIEWGDDISTSACRKLGFLHPVFFFIVDWPIKLKPFYIQPKYENQDISQGFDLMWSWMEIASGGTRVHKKQLLINRLKKQGLHPEDFKYHLQAFNYGMPPHAGWAIGFERLIMMLTGVKNIREVILYPRDRFRLAP